MPDLFSFTELQYWMFFQVLVRTSALIAVAPVFGAREVPAPIKVGLAVILSLVITPVAEHDLTAQGLPTSFYGVAANLAGQTVIGLMMGFVVSLIITAVQLAGSLLDLEVGFSLAQTFNPTLGEMSSPITQFLSFYALLLFILAHGHYVLIEALAKSFHAAPVTALNLGGDHALRFFTDITYNVFLNGLKIAAPASAILVLMDLSLALISRAMPQMNVFFVGMPVKALVGIALVAIVLPLFAIVVGQMVSQSPIDLSNLFAGLKD